MELLTVRFIDVLLACLPHRSRPVRSFAWDTVSAAAVRAVSHRVVWRRTVLMGRIRHGPISFARQVACQTVPGSARVPDTGRSFLARRKNVPGASWHSPACLTDGSPSTCLFGSRSRAAWKLHRLFLVHFEPAVDGVLLMGMQCQGLTRRVASLWYGFLNAFPAALVCTRPQFQFQVVLAHGCQPFPDAPGWSGSTVLVVQRLSSRASRSRGVSGSPVAGSCK